MALATTTAAAPTFDVRAVRADFPALHQEVNGYPLVYLDNAATSQKPETVIRALAEFYRRDNANVHRGIHELSRRATEAYEAARARMAHWLGATDPAEIVFTRGTTEAINLVAAAWGNANVHEGDEIVLTVLEHHSNVVPWQLLARRSGARLRYLDIDDEGRLRLEQLDELLGRRTKIVCVNHVSNSLGTINPVAEIARRAHDVGALLLVDGAQGAPHLPVSVAETGCDFYACSGHKMCGPTGIGALWARRELLEAMPPYQGGGEMISVVEKEYSTWAAVPHKFEAGTPNFADAVAMTAAIDYLEGIGRPAIMQQEHELVCYALERLRDLPGIRIYGPSSLEDRAAVISFTLQDAHPHDIATILDHQGIAIRAGHHCTQLVMKRYGITATARASFAFYNTQEEVDRLVDGLGEVVKIFGA
ncbi:MAG: cysteine desulfurase [Gemmatimonadetes bacterium]|nr:cysteine desulfurase [Gemmatimonadota bacterium]